MSLDDHITVAHLQCVSLNSWLVWGQIEKAIESGKNNNYNHYGTKLYCLRQHFYYPTLVSLSNQVYNYKE